MEMKMEMKMEMEMEMKMEMEMGLGLKFELMGLSGTQNFFISNFQMNKILFYLQILSLS